MNTCDKCNNATSLERLEKYRTNDFGIPLVLENAVSKYSCSCCDEVYIDVPNPEGLIAAAAVTRATMNQKLNGSECVFLRKSIGFSAKDMASKLDVKPETLSRWENDKTPISSNGEKLLRVMAIASLSDLAPAIDVSLKDVALMKIVGIADPSKPQEIVLRLVEFKEKGKDLEENYSKAV